jgi:membrane protein YqaA with SNARE-associated domain
MEWLNIGAEAGLWGMFLSSFLAATLLPGGSEALLFVLLQLHPEEWWPALGLATLGNTLGGMISYASGRWLPRGQKFEHLPGQDWVRRWGSPILLLAWTPLIGDALCIGTGWLRLDWRACAAFMALGKFARYWVVAQGAVW